MPTPKGRILTLEEVAAHLQLTPDEMWEIIEEGFPGIRVGDEYFVGRGEVDAWIAGRTVYPIGRRRDVPPV